MNCFQTCWKCKNFHVNQCFLVEDNSNRSDLSYLSATSLVFSSMLFLPPTVSSTTSSHVLNVVGHVESIKNVHINHHHHSLSHPSWKNSNWSDWLHPNASDLPGLLLLVVLAVHSVVDHETTWPKSRQVGYPRKGFSMKNKVLQSLSVG